MILNFPNLGISNFNEPLMKNENGYSTITIFREDFLFSENGHLKFKYPNHAK